MGMGVPAYHQKSDNFSIEANGFGMFWGSTILRSSQIDVSGC